MRKKEIVDHVKQVNLRLGEINKELGMQEELFVPFIDKDAEYPENFFEITDQDIEAFKAKKEADKLKARGKGKGQKGAETTANKKEEDEMEEDKKKEEVFDIENAVAQVRKGAKN